MESELARKSRLAKERAKRRRHISTARTPEEKAAASKQRRKEHERERLALMIRLANDRFPGYAELAREAETQDFQDWFYDTTGFSLGKLIYTDPEATIQYVQRAYELEKQKENQSIKPEKNESVIQYSRRRALKQKQATPPWFDVYEYKKLQELRALRNEMEPELAPFHIDHIIPLQGEIVSGLHVHTNMRVIPGRANLQKSNKFHVDG